MALSQTQPHREEMGVTQHLGGLLLQEVVVAPQPLSTQQAGLLLEALAAAACTLVQEQGAQEAKEAQVVLVTETARVTVLLEEAVALVLPVTRLVWVLVAAALPVVSRGLR
jgi:hypothetical protein